MRRRTVRLVSLVAVAALAMAACGGDDDDASGSTGAAATAASAAPAASSDATTGGSTAPAATAKGSVLNLVRQAMDQSLDPAIFYGGPANSIEMALYESLLRVKQGTPDTPSVREYIPWLATSWDISPDAKVYTFHLRDDVTFHDGTKLDAEAVRYSFQRSIDIADAPSYMLKSVDSMKVIDPTTLEITLKQPEDGFLDYFTSPYGPKIVSPTLMEANKGEDNGQTFLQTHDAGSGPYVLAKIAENVGYTLTAFPDYWGDPPYYETVNYKIVPDVTSQLLQFEQGDVDILTSAVGTNDLQRLSSDDKYKIDYRPGTAKGYLMMNPNKGLTKNEDFRLAVAASIDRNSIVQSVFGKLASVSASFYPPGAMPAGKAPDPDRYDPDAMKKLLAAHPEYKGQSITMAHGSGADDRQFAETLQVQFKAAGIDVTLKELTGTQAFDYVGKPLDAPELFLSTGIVDTAAPASWAQTYLLKDSPVNWLSIDVPAADAAVTKALASSDADERTALYEEAAKAWLDSGEIVTILDPLAFVLYHKDKVSTYKYDLTNNSDARPETYRP